LYLDGGFVTASRNPKDWDACFDYASVTDPTKLDPVFLDFKNERAAQKKKYLGETFPAYAAATNLGEPYLSFFQKNKRTGGVKGIVKLDLGTVI
jgi:hypothetical protein